MGKKGRRRAKWYRKARNEYFLEHPHCELCLEDGKKNSVIEIHHKARRSGALLWHKEYFCSLCFHCHIIRVHGNEGWARDNGWIIDLSKKEIDLINEFYRVRGMY